MDVWGKCILIPSVTNSCAQDSSLTEHIAMLNNGLLMKTEQQHPTPADKACSALKSLSLCHQALGQGYQINGTDLKIQNVKLGH